MGNDQSRVYMDYKNQQYVRTRRMKSRDTPRRVQSTRNQAPRPDEGPHDGGDRGRGRTQNSRPQAPQEEEEYYSEDEYPQPPRPDERPDARRGRRQIIARGHHHLHSWGMAVKALQDHKKLASTRLRALILLLRLNTSHEEAEQRENEFLWLNLAV
ncbi:hypothetical protein ABVK25_006765 [Lepraria finkii]|uniref:Uncharacterized protein n=1 Tax=Lepraria finkii TaxID=1340010 RepID=A0ABR4B4N0_9LECA